MYYAKSLCHEYKFQLYLLLWLDVCVSLCTHVQISAPDSSEVTCEMFVILEALQTKFSCLLQ
jgi:hypothetical protein